MKELTINLHRLTQTKVQTMSVCAVKFGDLPMFASVALERGWNNNIQDISCIPIGEYEVVYEWSEAFQMMLWEIKNVPNRSECKFHSANFWQQLKGCIALGRTVSYINEDSELDVSDSRNTLKDFHKVLKGQTNVKLIVTGEPGLF